MVLVSEPVKKATLRRFVKRPPALPLPPLTIERNIRTRGSYHSKISIDNIREQ